MKIFWFVVKWLVIPAAIGFLGYKFVGPNIGAVRKAVASQVGAAAPEKVASAASESAGATFQEPDVEITVKKSERRPERRRRSSYSSSNSVKPVVKKREAPKNTEPEPEKQPDPQPESAPNPGEEGGLDG